MAQRRMFSPDIVESEEFLTMPISSQALYFHLGMGADDDGFIQPKMVMKMLGANDDDLKVLLAKRFLLTFETGVVIIKHWLIHNMIRSDRYKPTRFQDEKKSLKIKENKAYTELGCQNDNQMAPQVRLGKVRLGKVNSIATVVAQDVIPNLLENKQEHIKIIGLFASKKGVNFTSPEHQREFIKRNLRSASALKPYELSKISEVMDWLNCTANYKWTLESVAKTIDENLNNLTNRQSKVVII